MFKVITLLFFLSSFFVCKNDIACTYSISKEAITSNCKLIYGIRMEELEIKQIENGVPKEYKIAQGATCVLQDSTSANKAAYTVYFSEKTDGYYWISDIYNINKKGFEKADTMPFSFMRNHYYKLTVGDPLPRVYFFIYCSNNNELIITEKKVPRQPTNW